eukprot:2722562-Rhodomonas_salina.1
MESVSSREFVSLFSAAAWYNCTQLQYRFRTSGTKTAPTSVPGPDVSTRVPSGTNIATSSNARPVITYPALVPYLVGQCQISRRTVRSATASRGTSTSPAARNVSTAFSTTDTTLAPHSVPDLVEATRGLLDLP